MVQVVEYIRLNKIDLKSKIGTRVFISFLARDVSIRLQKDKITKFIVLNMVDKEKVIEARLFGATDDLINKIQDGKVYNAAIDIKPYDKSPDGFSCIIYNIDNSNLTPESFADWAPNLSECKHKIEKVLTEYYDTYYGQITYPIVVKYWDKFSKWTAAKGQHHTQLGGLLLHTTEVIEIAEIIADYLNNKYGDNFINKPLLLCTAILHDIGKTLELDVDTLSGKTEYNSHSVLSTHIMDIISIVGVQAHELGYGYPEILDDSGYDTGQVKTDSTIEEEIEAVDLLKHSLASHHGKLEYGSPITPSTPEAYILNIADEISTTMFKFNKIFKSIEPGESFSTWTNGGLMKYYKDISKIGDMDDLDNLDN